MWQHICICPLLRSPSISWADNVPHCWCHGSCARAAASLLILWVPARLLHGRLLILGLPLRWKLALWGSLSGALLVLLELRLPLRRPAARWRLLILLRRGVAWRHLVGRLLPCACTRQHELLTLALPLCRM